MRPVVIELDGGVVSAMSPSSRATRADSGAFSQGFRRSVFRLPQFTGAVLKEVGGALGIARLGVDDVRTILHATKLYVVKKPGMSFGMRERQCDLGTVKRRRIAG
jgi:hypothetical protein